MTTSRLRPGLLVAPGQWEQGGSPRHGYAYLFAMVARLELPVVLSRFKSRPLAGKKRIRLCPGTGSAETLSAVVQIKTGCLLYMFMRMGVIKVHKKKNGKGDREKEQNFKKETAGGYRSSANHPRSNNSVRARGLRAMRQGRHSGYLLRGAPSRSALRKTPHAIAPLGQSPAQGLSKLQCLR